MAGAELTDEVEARLLRAPGALELFLCLFLAWASSSESDESWPVAELPALECAYWLERSLGDVGAMGSSNCFLLG